MSRTYGVYATMDQLKAYLYGEKRDEFTKDDLNLRRFSVQTARRFRRECRGRNFYPIRQTRYYDHPGNSTPGLLPVGPPFGTSELLYSSTVASRGPELHVDEDLLEIITLTTNNGGTTISSSDYYLKQGDSYNQTPYDTIELKTDGNQTTFLYSGTIQQSNSIDGYWGFHDDWSNAWVQVDTVQDDPMTSSATSLTVTDADGEDEIGMTPRFQVQQLIRFGTDSTAEYAYVTKVDVENDTLTIIRGVNGTTAAQQEQSTAIYVFRPMDDIVEAAKLLAFYSYRRKDSVGSVDDRGLASSTGVLIMPPKLPEEVRSAISQRKRVLVGGRYT